MEIFLPIVQVKIDIIFILFLSFGVGVLSGLFGVGGGFLMTPFLIFLGIPPVYAVPNEITNILSTSVSGSLTHWFKNTLDYKMGSMIIIGGVVGTTLGMTAFNFFNEIGKLSLIISLSSSESKSDLKLGRVIFFSSIKKFILFEIKFEFLIN